MGYSEAPESRTATAQVETSVWMKRPKASPFNWAARAPSSARRCLTSGDCRARLNASFSVAMTAGGVPAGATMPCQESAEKPGRPDSAMVGSWGRADERSGEVTARALRLPALIWGSAPGMVVNMKSTCPPSRSDSAGLPPL